MLPLRLSFLISWGRVISLSVCQNQARVSHLCVLSTANWAEEGVRYLDKLTAVSLDQLCLGPEVLNGEHVQ